MQTTTAPSASLDICVKTRPVYRETLRATQLPCQGCTMAIRATTEDICSSCIYKNSIKSESLCQECIEELTSPTNESELSWLDQDTEICECEDTENICDECVAKYMFVCNICKECM